MFWMDFKCLRILKMKKKEENLLLISQKRKRKKKFTNKLSKKTMNICRIQNINFKMD